ncbi:hypothetical protein C0993_006048 [Termitomyces sp. T159_Od127]|nr:hypothetical protein C0993_006048 [Termitomyces sp. T159_Od127]
MKAGWASTYALCILQRPGDVGSFTDWAAFEKDFWAEFFLIDPAKSAALTLHNREQYGQEKRTLDEYIDSFWALVERVAYPDGLQLCFTFQDGLYPTLMEHIDNLAKGCPDDKQVASWYKVAWDQWQLMEIWQELCQAHPAPCSTSMVTLQHPAPPHSVHYLSTVEQEELLLQLLAAKDTARALSPDEPALELAQEESFSQATDEVYASITGY